MRCARKIPLRSGLRDRRAPMSVFYKGWRWYSRCVNIACARKLVTDPGHFGVASRGRRLHARRSADSCTRQFGYRQGLIPVLDNPSEANESDSPITSGNAM